MPVATAHHPDGSVVCHPGAWKHLAGTPGKPLEWDREREDRALTSAKKAWWHPTSLDPTRSEPPVGALIKLDGEVKLRFDRLPVYDAAGEVVGTKLEWVDVQAAAREAVELAALAEMKAAHAVRKPVKP